MDKIGIVTLQGRFNYGNRLQNYAMEEVIKNEGFAPTSLILNRRPNALSRIRSVAKKVLGRQESPEHTMSKERLLAFDRFNQLMTFQEIVDPYSDEVSDYAFVVAGSDQIWAFKSFAYDEDWAFLQFARPEQRIALAPSFGIDSASSSQLKRLSRYLEKFERISVREEKGARLIKAATGRDVEVVCDPTLVLSPEEWRRISNHDLTPKSPYYFAYVLGGKKGEAGSALFSLSEEKELPIVYLSDREKPGEPPAGPAEFISLIDHAEHVVTDSFHAAVFASILQTPLTIVHREGGASMFSRLETLSEMLGIEQKIYGSPSFDLSRAGDCEGVQEAIARERVKFLSYFERCLHA